MLAKASDRPPAQSPCAQAPDWDSALYLKFERERTRAARDLLSHVEDDDIRVAFDLGCGPGNSTALLVERFPQAAVTGVDCSTEMLAAARIRTPGASFIAQRIETWAPSSPVDLIFANAALHFVPDHPALLTRLVSHLRPGGSLAVQMPNNMHELSHEAMRMVAADGPWADRLVPIAKSLPMIGPIEEYYRLLSGICQEVDIWQTTYVHSLHSRDEVVQWFEGSGLRPFLEPLDTAERVAFLSRYRQALAFYPTQPNGAVLLPYPRLCFVARK